MCGLRQRVQPQPAAKRSTHVRNSTRSEYRLRPVFIGGSRVHRTYFRALCDCISQYVSSDDRRSRAVDPFSICSPRGRENVLRVGGLKEEDFRESVNCRRNFKDKQTRTLEPRRLSVLFDSINLKFDEKIQSIFDFLKCAGIFFFCKHMFFTFFIILFGNINGFFSVLLCDKTNHHFSAHRCKYFLFQTLQFFTGHPIQLCNKLCTFLDRNCTYNIFSFFLPSKALIFWPSY